LNRFKAQLRCVIESIQLEMKMVPASYLFKAVYRDAWGIGLDAKEENYAEPAVVVRHGGLRRLAGAVLGAGRAFTTASKVAFRAPRAGMPDCRPHRG